MKKIILVFIVLMGMMHGMQAQTVPPSRQKNVQSKPFKMSEMPILQADLFYQKADNIIGIGGYKTYGIHKTYELSSIPYEMLDGNLPFKNIKSRPIWYNNYEFSNENFSKLPAVNTNDIIKILDKDRILTNW
ncbi:MAG: hypothetical protein IPK62_13120 [Bacteroidetes bacterium]|nr:hypothetical protein [Bacteroidota bacterium]